MKNKNLVWIVAGVLIILVVVGLVYFNDSKEEEVIKVGAVLPLTGFGSMFGQEMQRGMDLCNSGNVRYVYEDSASVATTGVLAYNKVTKIDDVDITIVGVSAVAEAVLPIAKENEDFVIASIVSSVDYGLRGGDTVFKYFTDGGKEAEEVSQFLIDTFEIKEAGILYLNNDYGLIYKNAMQNFFDNRSLNLTSDSFGLTDSDFGVQLLKMNVKGIKHIFIVAYDKQTLQVIKQAKELGIDSVLITSWFLADPNLQDENKELIEGVYFTIPSYYFNDENLKEFKENYKIQYNKYPNIYSTIGCDLSELIGDNKIKEPQDLTNIKEFTGLNGDMVQSDNGEFIFPVKMAHFINGSTKILN